MYTLTKVTKDYRQSKRTIHALRGVDLSIAEGQMVAVQGPTGGGKSTLLQMLGGLDRPTSGEVAFGDTVVSAAADRRLTRIRAQRIGFVFQNFNLIPTLSAAENVATALVPLGLAAATRRRRAAEALSDMGLADRMDHLPSELSGGQQQRVAVARALVKRPDVLLADEPTGNLDEGTREDLMNLLQALWRDRGLTLVIVTHDSEVAKRAQRSLVIDGGRVTEGDTRSPFAAGEPQ